MKRILVTGGAGYIGAHTVAKLLDTGLYKIDVVDNFLQGKNNILEDKNLTYHEVDLRDRSSLDEVFAKDSPEAVLHFAALASVPDSVLEPSKYYDHNIRGTLNLLDCMINHGVSKMVFSSSAAVYGEPESEIIDEFHPTRPINPYGRTKLMAEQILSDYKTAYGLSSISLRYFCAAGSSATRKIGEYHTPETHVIPVLVHTMLGHREQFFVYGNSFPTPDGTGVRDYIHVEDLADAHIRALDKLGQSNTICERFNLGINKGYSVLELIKAAEKITNSPISYSIKPPRPGDPARLVADASSAQTELDWHPKHIEVMDMISSTYDNFKSRK